MLICIGCSVPFAACLMKIALIRGASNDCTVRSTLRFLSPTESVPVCFYVSP